MSEAGVDRLLDRVMARTATIGVIGQGYVGLPLALLFAEAGMPVLGLDTDAARVRQLNTGRSFIRHIGDHRVAAAIESGRYRASDVFDEIAVCDAVMICVPTPLGRHREPDNSYIHRTGREIATRLRPGQLIVLESTTYPDTTRDELRPILEESGLVCGQDFFLAFSPEREDPGRLDFNTRTIPKVVGGLDPVSTRVAVAVYSMAIDKVVPVPSAAVAESTKLLENIFRSVNIALVNELKTVFDAMDIDVWEVIEAAKTKPFGFMPFYPGPGLGGHCIPLDPSSWPGRRLNPVGGRGSSNSPARSTHPCRIGSPRRPPTRSTRGSITRFRSSSTLATSCGFPAGRPAPACWSGPDRLHGHDESGSSPQTCSDPTRGWRSGCILLPTVTQRAR